MRKVIVVTPSIAKDAKQAELYARYRTRCLADSFARQEVSAAPDEPAHATAVYTDFDVTPCMQEGIENARRNYHIVEYRRLGEDWQETSSSVRNDM